MNFFRTIAGTIGVTIMGSVLATQVGDYLKTGLSGFQPTSQGEIDALQHLASGNVPAVSTLPDTIRAIVESAYGHGVADVFLIAIPLAVIGLIAIAFLPNKKLSTKNAAETLAEEAEEAVIAVAEAELAAVTSSVAVIEGDRPDASADRRGDSEPVSEQGR